VDFYNGKKRKEDGRGNRKEEDTDVREKDRDVGEKYFIPFQKLFYMQIHQEM